MPEGGRWEYLRMARAGRKGYPAEKRAKTLTTLAVTKNDAKRTAEIEGIGVRTVYRWQAQGPDYLKDKQVSELLEGVVKGLLGNAPDPAEANMKDWGIALGILLDKWMILGGNPTKRVENVTIEGRVLNLTDDQYRYALEEAEKILQLESGTEADQLIESGSGEAAEVDLIESDGES